MVDTEHTEHLTKDLTVIYNNGSHIVILRLQADMIFFFVESFDRCGIFYQCNDFVFGDLPADRA